MGAWGSADGLEAKRVLNDVVAAIGGDHDTMAMQRVELASGHAANPGQSAEVAHAGRIGKTGHTGVPNNNR